MSLNLTKTCSSDAGLKIQDSCRDALKNLKILTVKYFYNIETTACAA